MMVKKTKSSAKPDAYCRDCAFATEDWKFENLSLEGKPTLLKCSVHTERKRIVSEKGCNNFKAKEL